LIRAASSSALRSASAKSILLEAFVAPRPPSFVFFRVAELAPVLVLEVSLDAPNFPARTDDVVEDEAARRDDELTVRGAATGAATGIKPGDGVRPITGGVRAGVDAPDGGFGVDGLLQEVKKSSSAASSAVAVEVSTPSTTIPFGNLFED
jgi:hypothetical protein